MSEECVFDELGLTLDDGVDRRALASLQARRIVRVMSETGNTTPDGSTNRDDDERRYEQDLPDGSVSGDASQDPRQDSDVDSGGDPAEPDNQG